MRILLFLLWPIFTTTAEAKTPQQCPSTISNFFRGIDLDDSQQLLVEEMLQEKRAFQKDMKIHYKGFREKWMMDFVAGEMSRQQVHASIENRYNQDEDKHFEIRHRIVELLSSYTPEQIEKVLSNIDYTRQCYDEYFVPPARKTDPNRVRPKKVLLSDLNLSEEQQEKQKAIRSYVLSHRKTTKETFVLSREDLMDSMIRESNRRDAIMDIFEERSNRRLQFQKNRADLWMDFLESLDNRQSEQFIQNALLVDKLLLEEHNKDP